MKKMPNTVDNIKQRILELKGQVVDLKINRGRRKVASFRARITDVYASVFTVQNCTDKLDTISTYSYNDILCGEVKISNERI
ncbi:MAG: Veg family protein [Clostridia bacterium]|nr:Veg family protein [Clostridia bacterium]